MTEAEWITAIRANLDDDTVRLVFSDYLIEQGQDIRARFIQNQIEAVSLIQHCPVGWQNKHSTLLIAEREFIIEYGLNRLCGFELPHGIFGTDSACFVRGFLTNITAMAEDWITHGDTIYAATPLREVQLTTYPSGAEWLRICATHEQVAHYQLGKETKGTNYPWNALAEQILSLRWPGVTFSLPKEQPLIEEDTNPAMPISGRGH